MFSQILKRLSFLVKLTDNLVSLTFQYIQDDLKAWNVEIEPEPFKLKGRLLPPEKITVSQESVTTYNPANADWTRRKFAVI